MRDFSRLREQLRLALIGGALGATAASCGPSSPPASEPVGGGAATGVIGNQASDETPRVDPRATQDTPWPQLRGGCDSGQWCGAKRQVDEQVAAYQQVTEACAEYFDYSGASFSLDRDATERRAEQGEVGMCCYSYYEICGEGRPLLDGEHALRTPVRDGAAWARDGAGSPAVPPPVLGDPALRAALAAAWLDAARLEHASIASFARVTLELLALGAPPALLADTQRAGLDEVRHAEQCFALASRYLGRDVAPGPLPALAPREASLARLAVDTFVEGCAGETVATLAATRAAAACEDAAVARVLARIVRDETRHAALAWQTVAWAVRQGGAPVAAAVRARAHAMAAEVARAATGRDDVAPEALRAHGRLDAAARRAAAVDAWREIILPTLDELLERA